MWIDLCSIDGQGSRNFRWKNFLKDLCCPTATREVPEPRDVNPSEPFPKGPCVGEERRACLCQTFPTGLPIVRFRMSFLYRAILVNLSHSSRARCPHERRVSTVPFVDFTERTSMGSPPRECEHSSAPILLLRCGSNTPSSSITVSVMRLPRPMEKVSQQVGSSLTSDIFERLCWRGMDGTDVSDLVVLTGKVFCPTA